ncbi:NAD(P)-dependent alcohol dehydrogenase [Syntrophus sp. (in: bacteria)]|uniref:NADPH-dependent aldehyde reductase Ahr n=1 Tax=Syntrophus sp. (in: bacteria) TaxID=48412 RepID=UPI00345E4945
MSQIRAWAAPAAGKPLEAYSFDPGPLAPEEVEIAVEHCGICHSDLSVLTNEWGNGIYPCVAGHEVVGRVVALGEQAKGLSVGRRVGVGWNSGSCNQCRLCQSGDQHLCSSVQPTIVGHHGGFAERMRAHWTWVFPLPDGLDSRAAGPLLCGGITVFYPLLSYAAPTQRVGVVGIGGLGHMALKFAGAYGCDVTAFTSSDSKHEDARAFGAHRVIDSRDSSAMKAIARSLDLILYTANVPLDWKALMATLAPKGRFHVVGMVLEPMLVKATTLIAAEKCVSGSPTGPPSAIAEMLDFAARHNISPRIERFPMSRINEALEHLSSGKARYRIVLDADFG